MQIDHSEVLTHVETTPIKTAGGEQVDPGLLQAQAELARGAMVEVDYFATRGTCGDERLRVGLLNGEPTVEARPSVFGGPNVYGLAIAELTGMVPENVETGEEALRTVTRQLNAARIQSGGHAKCAANGGFASWMETIAGNLDAVVPYVEKELGARFDLIAMAEVHKYAQRALASGRYNDWSEDVLVRVLGDEAGEAIEILADVPHEAVMLEKNQVEGATVDQNVLYGRSVLGKGSFVVDDPYADKIDAVVTSGPEAAYKMVLAAHAREAMNAAVAGAVPNPELYQDTLI